VHQPPDALDPAIMPRAAATFTFDRPNDEQRHAVLRNALHGIDLAPARTGSLNRSATGTGASTST